MKRTRDGKEAVGTECVECSAPAPKYRCPTCDARYCSVKCCRAHKESGRHLKGKVDDGGDEKDGAVPPPRDTQAAPDSSSRQNEDEGWKLGREDEAKLRNATWLQAAVKDKRLQKILLDIDKAKDRESELRRWREQEPDFAQFIDKMLVEVGALKYMDNQEEPLFVAPSASSL